MDKLYYENILETNILLPCNIINKNIDEILLNILKNKIGNKCIKEGYVDKDSIEIIRRSLGKIDSNNLLGNLLYDIEYKANICIPLQNNIIDCVVVNNDKMGIIAKNDPLEIILARQHHENKEIFKTLKKNDKIMVKIIDKMYNLNDKNIIIIGKYIKNI